MHSWPIFKQQVEKCPDCQLTQFLELPEFGHSAIFYSPKAIQEFNRFIDK